jgi:hypothetical protein
MPQLNIFRSSFRSWLTVTGDRPASFRDSRKTSMSSVVLAFKSLSPNVRPSAGRANAMIFRSR